jgi:DNA-binding response OmpR family regulator
MPLQDSRFTRLLLCSSDKGKLEPLRKRFNAVGIQVDCVTRADDARQRLWDHHYNGIAIDLLLADRDGISFAMELREEHPRTSVLVISTTRETERGDSGPDWLSRSTDYARLIFALKQAGQRAAGRPPKILHVEEDDSLADLVQNTIGNQTQLFRARSAQEAQIAMALREYDLALIRTDVPQTNVSWQNTLSGHQPLEISMDTHNDPVLNILNNLRRPSFVHEPAYC